MAIIYSYPDKTPILGNDILLGTDRQNKNQTKNFTVDAIKDYVLDGLMNGTARRLPIYGTSDKLTNSLFFQDQAATSGTAVLGTLVTLDNGNGFGSLSVAQNITAQTGNLTVSQGNGYVHGFLGVGVQGDSNYKLNVLGTAKASQSVFVGETTQDNININNSTIQKTGGDLSITTDSDMLLGAGSVYYARLFPTTGSLLLSEEVSSASSPVAKFEITGINTSVSIGNDNTVIANTAKPTVAIGKDITAQGIGGVAIGSGTSVTATATDGIAIGKDATADQIETVAIGTDANATVAGEVYIGGTGVRIKEELSVLGTGQSSFAGQVTIPQIPVAATDAASKDYVDNATAGGLIYQGSYDAATNTPDLTTSPNSIQRGWTYTVTVAGTFFTENVEIGDLLIAEVDNPSALTDWTTVQNNVDLATLTTVGIGNVNEATNGDISVSYSAGTATIDLKDDVSIATNLTLSGSLTDGSNSIGAAGYLLSSTGAVTEWIENTAITGTGSTARVPRWTSTGSLEDSIMIAGNLTVGIGTPNPSANQYADYVLNLTTGGLRIDNDSDEKIHLRSTLSTGDVKITFNQMGNQRASVGFEDSSTSAYLKNDETSTLLKVKAGINGLTYTEVGEHTVWHEGNKHNPPRSSAHFNLTNAVAYITRNYNSGNNTTEFIVDVTSSLVTSSGNADNIIAQVVTNSNGSNATPLIKRSIGNLVITFTGNIPNDDYRVLLIDVT
jgi:hypothetical protein